MPADDAFQPYKEPELDENGLPIQPPGKGHPYWVAVGFCACAVLQVLAYIAYRDHEHPNQITPPGLRVQTLGAALIGPVAFSVWATRRMGKNLKGAPWVITLLSVLVIASVTVLLFIAGVLPHGMCNHGCSGGGY